MILTIKQDYGKDITIDTDRRDKNLSCPDGSMVCHVYPVFGLPLQLEIAITPDGTLIHRGYTWITGTQPNTYLHVSEAHERLWPVTPTPAMAETLAGLFSGRITIDGIKIAVGATPQRICPIDLEAKEKRISKKIYLA